MKTILKLMTVVALLAPAQSMAADKFMNVRVDPLGALLGIANVGLDFAVTDNITLGVEGSFWSLSSGSSDLSATGFGVKGQYFFNQAFTDSWYVAPYFNITSGKGEDSVTLESDIDVDVTTLGVLFGYMWMWENFNIQLGGGFRNVTIDSSSTTFATFEGTGAALEWTLGWAF